MLGRPVTDEGLERFNASSHDAVRDALSACCASGTWVARLDAGRPYRDREDLLEAAELACHDLDDVDLAEALTAHPRIGERASGATTEAQWSRQEQSAVSGSDDRTRTELREANIAYERRFDRVFLIRAAGRTPEEILDEARRRLRNDPATERREVAEQLGQIARLRVEKLLEP